MPLDIDPAQRPDGSHPMEPIDVAAHFENLRLNNPERYASLSAVVEHAASGVVDDPELPRDADGRIVLSTLQFFGLATRAGRAVAAELTNPDQDSK